MYFYPNVDSSWEFYGRYREFSLFQNLLSYSIEMVPSHALQECTLMYSDLGVHYSKDILQGWNNLKVLSIYLCEEFKNIERKKCKANLTSILIHCKQLTSVKVITPRWYDTGFQYDDLLDCLQETLQKQYNQLSP